MSRQVDAPGFATMLIVVRLIQRLVLQKTISLETAREMIDSALMDAERVLGNSPQGAAVRELLESFLADIRNTRDV
jgi:hypothetical protein